MVRKQQQQLGKNRGIQNPSWALVETKVSEYQLKILMSRLKNRSRAIRNRSEIIPMLCIWIWCKWFKQFEETQTVSPIRGYVILWSTVMIYSLWPSGSCKHDPYRGVPQSSKVKISSKFIFVTPRSVRQHGYCPCCLTVCARRVKLCTCLRLISHYVIFKKESGRTCQL